MQINNETYLVPIGQALADKLDIVTVNEYGRKIWDLLACETTVSEIVAKLSAEITDTEFSTEKLTSTVAGFVRTLRSKGMLIEHTSFEESFNNFKAAQTCIKIGPALICIKSCFDVISESLQAFTVSADTSAQYSQFVSFDFGFKKPSENGCVIARNNYLTVMELSDKYILLYHEFSAVREIHISKDYRYVSIYATGIPGAALKSEFSIALRDCVLMLLREHGLIMLHSASILYHGKLYCFAAASGTGKSTHTNLWKSLCDTPVINGDLNLLCPKSGTVTVYGTPWCGTSDIFSVKAHPLGGIIFLSRGDCDTAAKITASEALPKLIARIATPYYCDNDFTKICDTATTIADSTDCYTLSCTTESSSVTAIKALL